MFDEVVAECEMCGIGIVSVERNFRRWHQTKPVERWLCNGCAVEDQKKSANWAGEYLPGWTDTK